MLDVHLHYLVISNNDSLEQIVQETLASAGISVFSHTISPTVDLEDYLRLDWDVVLSEHLLLEGDRANIIELTQSRSLPLIVVGNDESEGQLEAAYPKIISEFSNSASVRYMKKDNISGVYVVIRELLNRNCLTKKMAREDFSSVRQAFLQTASAIVIVDGKSFNVVEANDAAIEVLGCEYHNLRNRTIFDFVDPESFRPFSTDRKSSGLQLLGRGIRVDITVLYKREDEWIVQLREVDFGQTERDYLILSSGNEDLTVFRSALNGMTHHFNNTLSTVIQFVGVLLKSKELEEHHEESFKKWARGIEEIALEGAQLLKEMKGLYDDDHPREDAIDLNKTIRDIVDAINRGHPIPGFESGKYSIKLQLQPNLPFIQGNKGQLKEMILNVVRSSIGVAGKDRDIKISTSEYGPGSSVLEVLYVDVEMSPKEVIKSINPFYTKAKGNYNILDLSTAYGVALSHRAKMMVKSESDKGTVVRLRFANISSSPSNQDQ